MALHLLFSFNYIFLITLFPFGAYRRKTFSSLLAPKVIDNTLKRVSYKIVDDLKYSWAFELTGSLLYQAPALSQAVSIKQS